MYLVLEPYDPFYQLGQNAIRKITAGKFIYSGEEINPVLQKNEGINIPEFSELELNPVRNLNGIHDINIDQYAEVDQINSEAKEYVEPYVVVNNRGKSFESSPFDNDFMD